MTDGRYVQAFLTLIEGRTEQEIAHILGVVEASLRAMDAAAAAELARWLAQVEVRVFTLAGAG
jgi:hypothetical protein